MKPDYQLATFVGDGALGTAHSVFLREHLEEALFLERSRHTSDTLVLLETPSEDEHNTPLRVKFFANGYSIQRCGSGTLAAAWVSWKHGKLGSQEPLYLRTSLETVRVFKDQKGFGYESEPLPQETLQDTLLWQRIVNAPIKGGALCGTDGDYVIIELASEEAVRGALPDLSTLTQATGRALILTSRESKAHYVLRYFAPQYGQPEGGATGSANTQLLRYWYGQGCRETLTARQCSTSGGEFWGQPTSGTIRLFGRVKTL